MNAKSEIIEMLKKWVSYYENYNERYPYASQEYSKKQIEYYGNLIAATEKAIFDVPSEENEIENWRVHYYLSYPCNYKPETDGK